MLQDTASRVFAVTAFSLFITILMYQTLSRVPKPLQMFEEEIWKPTIYSGWGDGWSSLFQAGGEPFEDKLLRSANGKFAFTMKSDGELVYENRKKKKNTTIFSQKAGGVHGIEGEEVPEGAILHSRLSNRGTLVVFYERTNERTTTTESEPSEAELDEILNKIDSRAIRSNAMHGAKRKRDLSWGEILQRIEEDHDADEGDNEQDHNHDIGSIPNVIWNSNRLPDCHKIPRGAYPPSTPFLQLDDNGALYISTSNEINCMLKAAEGS